ncbi:MAG TPA: glycosyltransferase family 9 protein [Ignavibacteria bacterium]|jgi:ADP-heptose:LPS heptosyltransferase
MKTADKVSFSKADENFLPKRILIIRLHAIGDTAITLPLCQALRKLFPSAEIDYLAGERSMGLLQSLTIFNNIYSFPDYKINRAPGFFIKLKRYKASFSMALKLRRRKYDVFIDLQHNRISKIIRKVSGVKYWSELDRYAPEPASLRMIDAFRLAGFNITPEHNLSIRKELLENASKTLFDEGWNGKEKLVVLNPAGLWKTRNWQIENYVSLSELFLKNNNVKFLILGDERISEKAKSISMKLDDKIIDLTEKTTLSEALTILSMCSLLISEDSALFHMSWALGVPSLVMLGSTRSDWTCHDSKHVLCLSSDDLECGNCMEPECRYEDVHCLTRYSPEFVYKKAMSLFGK